MSAVLVLPAMITDPRPTSSSDSLTVAIIGGGPAGMSCANACLSFGLTPIVIERTDHVGGAQRTNFHPNLWMLGSPGESGEDMTRRMAEHYASLPISTLYRTEVARVEKHGPGFTLTLAVPDGGSKSLNADAVVLATGMQPYATPELEKLARASSKVIIGPLSHTIRDGIRNENVLILGGGDNALDHALFLAELGNRVLVCARAAISARAAFLASCAERPEIELRDHCVPTRLTGDNACIRVEWPGKQQEFQWLLVMFGYRPNTDLLEHLSPHLRPDMTANGHVHVDSWQRTSTPRIYAAGDITDTPQPSVLTAIAQGLVAARIIEREGHAN